MPARLIESGAPLTDKVVLLSMQEQFPDASWPQLEQRLTHELTSMGLKVVAQPARARAIADGTIELGRTAVEHRAVASLRIIRGRRDRRVQVWVYDAITEKMVFRELSIASASDPQTTALAALRTVEILQASWLEVRLSPPTARSRRVPPTVARIIRRTWETAVAPRAPRKRWVVWVEPAVAFLFGGSSASGMLAVGSGIWLQRWMLVGAELAGPILPGQISDGPNKVGVFPFTATAVALLVPWSLGSLSPHVGLGLGVASVHARGKADVLAGQTDWAGAGLLTIRLGVSGDITSRLQWLAGALVGLTLPPMTIDIAERRRATSWPVLAGRLGLQWRF